VNNVIFENGEGENIRLAKYPALCKRGLCILKSPLIWNVFWYLLDIIVLLAHASVFQCRSINFDCSGTIVVWDYTYIIQHNQSNSNRYLWNPRTLQTHIHKFGSHWNCT